MQLRRDAEAAAVMRLVIDSNPGWARGKALLAASEAQVGNIEHAKRLMAEYVAGDPGITIRAFSDERSSVPLAAVSPIYRRELEHIHEGLRRAGMPDQ